MKCKACEEKARRIAVLEAALAVRSDEVRRMQAALDAIRGPVPEEVPDPREPDWLDELEEDEGGGMRLKTDN